MPSGKILVLVHQNDAAFPYFKYLIKLLMKDWERSGLTVEVARGIDHFVPADVVIPHLDMTIMPADYQDFLTQYPVVLNRAVVDVSKSKISANIVCRDDSYEGPVIVKTDFNSGGLPDKRLSSNLYLVRALSAKLKGRLFPFRTRRARQTAWSEVRHLDSAHYPVFPYMQDGPKE